MKIYVSNLPAGSSNASLVNLFQPFGVITSAHVVTVGTLAAAEVLVMSTWCVRTEKAPFPS